MRLKDSVHVLVTLLIILIWCFSVKWSPNQEAAKRSYEVNGFVTDCDNPGLFKIRLNCCPVKHCPANYFPFHIYSGVADVVAAKICFNNTVIMGGIRNNAGPGLNIVIANGGTGEVLRNDYFNVKSKDSEELLAYLKTLKPGNIVLVASHIDPTPQLTDEIREIFTALGSTMVTSLKPRDSWVFAGTYGIKEARPFEKDTKNSSQSFPRPPRIIGKCVNQTVVPYPPPPTPRSREIVLRMGGVRASVGGKKLIQNDVGMNAYGDWPETGKVIGCLPRITE